MVGVLCPSIFEYGILRKLPLKKYNAYLHLSGMGKVRSLFGCHQMLKQHTGTRAILLTGFAGALTSNLRVGDVIEPCTFIEYDYDARPFEKFPNKLKKSKPALSLLGLPKDTAMLTQDRFLKENPCDKNKDILPKAVKRLACDMESYAVAYFCQESKLPYSVVKIISDSADHKADVDFISACRALAPKLQDTVVEALKKLSR